MVAMSRSAPASIKSWARTISPLSQAMCSGATPVYTDRVEASYHIEGNFGEVFNLVIRRFCGKSPNLKPANISFYDVMTRFMWRDVRANVKRCKLSIIVRNKVLPRCKNRTWGCLPGTMLQQIVPLHLKKSEHAVDIFQGTWPTMVLLRTTATAYGASVFVGSRLQSNSSPVDGLQMLL